MQKISALAVAAVLATGLSFAAQAGSVDSNTTVTGTNTVSGIGNSGSLAVDNIGNGKIVNKGKGDVHKNVDATFDQTVSGIDNSGSTAAGNIGNGDIRNGSKKPYKYEPRREHKDYDHPELYYAPTVKSKAVNR